MERGRTQERFRMFSSVTLEPATTFGLFRVANIASVGSTRPLGTSSRMPEQPAKPNGSRRGGIAGRDLVDEEFTSRRRWEFRRCLWPFPSNVRTGRGFSPLRVTREVREIWRAENKVDHRVELGGRLLSASQFPARGRLTRERRARARPTLVRARPRRPRARSASGVRSCGRRWRHDRGGRPRCRRDPCGERTSS